MFSKYCPKHLNTRSFQTHFVLKNLLAVNVFITGVNDCLYWKHRRINQLGRPCWTPINSPLLPLSVQCVQYHWNITWPQLFCLSDSTQFNWVICAKSAQHHLK